MAAVDMSLCCQCCYEGFDSLRIEGPYCRINSCVLQLLDRFHEQVSAGFQRVAEAFNLSDSWGTVELYNQLD